MTGILAIALALVSGDPPPEVNDTLKSSKVISVSSGVIVPQRISGDELAAAAGVSEAVRRFAGVQLRDYGGVGGLKTINVRSLGSEHTGVFVDGIQVDNAQNMQVDLGRFGLEGFGSVSLFGGQKSSPLQSAKEYSSASALYLESAEPVFRDGKRANLRAGLRGGSFGTVSPSVLWERRLKSGASLRLSGEAVRSGGEYRFKVRDFRSYPGGHIEGYDTTMTRKNCDLRSTRLEGRLFSAPGGEASWNLHTYLYSSDRGLPGPVFKRAGEYPLSEDRQKDMDAFAQGRYMVSLGERWSLMAKAKCSLSHLEYIDAPELRPDLAPVHFNYRNHSAYLSGAASWKILREVSVNFAQDIQYDYLDADLTAFSYPGRLSLWSSVSVMALFGGANVSLTALSLRVHDTFLSGGARSKAERKAFMPSAVLKWKLCGSLSLDAMAKRSYRMPTFNDLYYSTVSSKTLDPEDATQMSLGARWRCPEVRGWNIGLRTEVYHNRLRNKIIAVPTSNQFRWSMYNLGKVHVMGADVTSEFERKIGSVLAGGILRYTFQRVRDWSEGKGALSWGGQIPYIPLHSGSVNLFGDFPFGRLDITFFATGERYTTSANLPSYRLMPWRTLDASLSRHLKTRSGELSLKLSLNNLLNERYEIVDNYPMPGASVLGKVEYSF